LTDLAALIADGDDFEMAFTAKHTEDKTVSKVKYGK
jgi:hypothetical protein